MPRAKIWGLLACAVSLSLFLFFVYSVFYINRFDLAVFNNVNLGELNNLTYYSAAAPLLFTALSVIGTGFWIGWTILTIKVVPPMPEIVEKKDNSKIKAFFLCLSMAALAGALIYGVYIRNFWALAVPALVIAAVVLGAVFWVGLAILTTRTTLPVDNK